MSESTLIRDFFNVRVTQEVASSILSKYKEFEKNAFVEYITSDIENQTYSERKVTFTDALIKYLPADYDRALDILLSILPPAYETEKLTSTTTRFHITAYTAYISTVGIDHFEKSMSALYEITKCFTSEFDIRLFILKYPKKSFALLQEWARDNNPHVRRLVSEGSRPNLPWGKKLKLVDEDPASTTIPLLSILQDDSAEYVRKSVANHLNDLSKNNAQLVVSTLTEWQNQNPNTNKDRLINHALRTLIKKGHKGALKLIGYDDDFDLELNFKSYSAQVPWSGIFDFECSIKNNRNKPKLLLIDYIIGFKKKDGSISDKVFKLKKTTIAPSGSLDFKKKQSFKPITTRVYYPGEHTLSIQVNGKILGKISFKLESQSI